MSRIKHGRYGRSIVRAGSISLAVSWVLLLSAGLPAQSQTAVQSPAQKPSSVQSLTDLDYVAESEIGGAATAKPSVPLRQASPLTVEPIAPLPDVSPGTAVKERRGEAVSPQTLGSAMQDMIRRNPVVAVVEGEEIRWVDVVESARDLPAEYQSRIESIFPALLDRLIDLKLLANAGREEDLDEDEALRRRARAFEDLLIRDAYVAANIAPKVPEADVRARYFEVLRANSALTERHLHHVVVGSRAEALAVVQSLDDGLDFAELARDYSTGDSAARGGDLGFIRRDSLDPGFAAAAFDLKVGTYGRRPLRTRFGWHVIKVESERKAELPTYEDLAPKLRDELVRQRINKVLKRLRSKADLELFPEQ